MDKYYLRGTGYVGNCLIWWRPQGRGYTTNLDEAGKFDEDEAMKIIIGSHGEVKAYLCWDIDNSEKGVFRTFHSDYINEIKELSAKSESTKIK